MTEVKTVKFRVWDPAFMGEYCSDCFHECCIRITEIIVSITQPDTNFPNFILRQELFTFYMETTENFGLPVRTLSAIKYCDSKTKKNRILVCHAAFILAHSIDFIFSLYIIIFVKQYLSMLLNMNIGGSGSGDIRDTL